MTIGVFDSGKGGSFIAERLRTLLPQHKYIVANDHEHVPYGVRPQSEIVALTDQAIQPLLQQCPIIVIACNTITTASIHELRSRYPDIQFVGLEPMIKPASLSTKSGHIVVLATPYTLHSERYQDLKQTYANALIVDEPDTGNWPRMIEDGKSVDIDLRDVEDACSRGADTIVLGCTHYLALAKHLSELLPDVTILEPSDAIARRLMQVEMQVRRSSSIDQYD